jgi:hypothetical protein
MAKLPFVTVIPAKAGIQAMMSGETAPGSRLSPG